MPFPTISGLTLRLESDLGITKDGSNRVATWADQATTGYNFTQGTDGLKPVHTPNIFGTASGLLFSAASGQFMLNASAISNLLSANGYHIFCVFRQMSTTAAIKGLWCTDNGTGANNVLIGQSASVGTHGLMHRTASSQITATFPGQILTKSYLMECTYQSGVNLRSFDRLMQSKKTITTASLADLSATALGYGSYLGRYTTAYFDGYIGALIMFNRSLNTLEAKQVCDYLIAGYDIKAPAVFIDQTSGNDSNDGLKMSTARKTIKGLNTLLTAVGASSYGARFIVRNNGSEDTTGSSMSPPAAGSSRDLYELMNWQRPSISLTADFTKGSSTVTNCSQSLTTYAHGQRYITGPDGRKYTISFVNSGTATTFSLVELYKGTTVTGGSFTILADEFKAYTDALTVADGADQRATWDADGHTRPRMYNSSGGTVCFYLASIGWRAWNIIVGDAPATTSSYLASLGNTTVVGCLFWRTTNYYMTSSAISVVFRNCGFIGTGNAAHTLALAIGFGSACDAIVLDSATKDCYYDIYQITHGNARVVVQNCSLGVDGAPLSGKSIVEQTHLVASWFAFCRDVRFHPSATPFASTAVTSMALRSAMISQNHDMIAGAWKIILCNQGTLTQNAGSGISLPTTNIGWVYQAVMNLGAATTHGRKPSMFTDRGDQFNQPLFETITYQDGSSRNIRLYVMSDVYLSPEDLFMEVRYVSEYGDTTNYSEAIVRSSGSIAAKGSTSDWTQYLECAIPAHGVGPDGTSRLYIQVFCTKNDLTSDNFYMNPVIDGLGDEKVLLLPPEYGTFQSIGMGVKFPVNAGKVRADESFGRVSSLTSGTLPLNRVSPNAPVAGTQDLPDISSVQPTDTLEGVTGTSDKALSLAEEALRNKFNTGTTVADMREGKSVKIQNVDQNGTLPQDDILVASGGNFDEAARNQVVSGDLSNDLRETATIKLLNVDYTGGLPNDKILKSATSPGNWNDDNLQAGDEGNVVFPVEFGLNQEGAAIAGDPDTILKSAGGNWNDENLSDTDNVKTNIAYGLNSVGTGGFVKPIQMTSFRRPLTVTRKSPGTTVDGNFVEGATSTFTIMASLQPLKPEDVAQYDFGRRQAKWMSIITGTRLYGVRPATPLALGINPDWVNIGGEEFLIEKEEIWQNAIIPHYKYLVAKEIEA